MTNDKLTAEISQAPGPEKDPAVDNKLPGEKKNVKVMSLAIDENDDFALQRGVGRPFRQIAKGAAQDFFEFLRQFAGNRRLTRRAQDFAHSC